MTKRNTSGERLSERDVDRLLQQFFYEEVPAEFRRDGRAVALARPHLEPLGRTGTSDSSRSLAGLLGLLVSVTCCLAVTMFLTRAPLDESGPQPGTAIGETDRSHEPATDEPVPIEERSHLRFTTMENHARGAGSETENTAPLEPELEIEIFPLRPDKPRE